MLRIMAALVRWVTVARGGSAIHRLRQAVSRHKEDLFNKNIRSDAARK